MERRVLIVGHRRGLRRTVISLSRRVIQALRIEWGMTHLEIYLSDRGPLFGEIALRPPGGYIMDALDRAYGFDSWRAFASVELDSPFDFKATPTHVAAAMVLHPGPGRVAAVRGVSSVHEHPCVSRVAIRVSEGDEVGERVGIGVDVGHVLFRAPSRAELLEAIDFVDRNLKIEMERSDRTR